MKEYPQKLLPQPKYKLIDCNLDKYHLVRHFEIKDSDDAIEIGTNIIKSKYICTPKENMRDLSTNLVGRFKLKYLKIELTPQGRESYGIYCAPDTKVALPLYERDYVLNNNRDKWFLSIKDIANIEVDYNVGSDYFKAKCEITHTPMRWNYWHFSIRWLLKNTDYWHDLDPKNKKKWISRLAFTSRSHIQKLAFLKKPDIKIIKGKKFLN